MIPSSIVVRIAMRLLRVLPVASARQIARVCGLLGFWFARERRRVIMENLEWLSPDLSPRARRAAARRTFANLLEASVDLWRLPTLRPGLFDTLVGVEGRAHLEAARALRKGVIVVTAHLGPYELGGAWLAHLGYPAHAMVEELDFETNAVLSRYREATGMQTVPRSAGSRVLLRLLRDDQIVILVADRVIGDGAGDLEVPFGHGRRAIPTGPAALALATGAPIVVGVITRSPHRPTRYLVRLEPPMFVTPGRAGREGRSERDHITRQISERLSEAAMASPDQWFVFQPQWIRRSDAS